MSKRPGTMSDDERATIGAVHRRVTPARGNVVSDFEQPITGVLEGDALAAARGDRPIQQRIAHVEIRLDDLKGAVDARLNSLEVGVANMSGKLDVLPELISVVRQSADRAAQREHVTFTAKVDVDKAQQLDAIDSRKDKRKLWAVIVGAVFSGAGIGKLLHELGLL